MKILVNNVEMAYDDTGGTSVPLVLIHGFPLDRTYWAGQVSALANVARVITPDLRGFGESSLPNAPVSIAQYADDVRGLLDALGIERAIIAGLSMGGYIALSFYRQFANRVRALILADTRAGTDSPEGKLGRDVNINLVREQGAAVLAERLLPKLLLPQTLATNAPAAQFARAMLSRQPVEAIAAALAALRDRPDATPRLNEINAPTLIIVGEQDALTLPSDSHIMRDAIHDAQLVTIPNAAHLANLEQPAAFNRAIQEFLASL